MTGLLAREAHAGPSALQQGLSARRKRRIYLRVAAAASPSHGLCRPPLSGSSRLRRRGLQSEAGARPRGARTHPLTPRGPAPLRLSVARAGTPSAIPIGRAPGVLVATSLLPWLPGAGSRGRCARSGTHHSCPSSQGWPGPDSGRPLHSQGLVLVPPQRASTARGLGAGLRQQVRPRRCARPARPPLPFAPLHTYRAAGGCAGVSGVGRLVHLPPRGPGVRAGRRALRRACEEVRPELGGLASATPGGRLHLLLELLSHFCGRCSCRGGGGAGLGAIIWEDAVPCSAGAVVPPLKKPAPHCSQAAAAEGRGRPSPRGDEETAAPAPDCCPRCTSCPVAAPAGSCRVGI